MKRKVIKQSDSFTITLPMKWVKSKGIKPGDEIDLEIEKGKIIVDTEAKTGLESVEIGEVDKTNLRTVIGVAYRAGYNKVLLKLKEEVSLSEAQKNLAFFTGMEVEELKKDKLTLRCITPVNPEEYDFFVKKIFLTLKLMADEVINFTDGKEFNFSNLEEMRKNNLKAREYCMRAINTTTGKESSSDEYTFIHILEKISALFWKMGMYVIKNKPQKSSKIKELLVFIKELIDKSYHVYLKKDYDAGVKVLSDRFAFRKEWLGKDKLLKLYRTKGVDPVLLGLIANTRNRISSAMSRYLTTVIRR